MKIKPYLMFNGRAEEAANFYAGLPGGKIETLFRYSEMPPMPGYEIPADFGQKIGHATVAFSGGTFSMADTLPSDPRTFGNGGHMLTLLCDSADQARKAYDKLCDGAQKINCELQKVFYAERYGEVVDRFGILWAIMFEK
jgi:PhnB protein